MQILHENKSATATWKIRLTPQTQSSTSTNRLPQRWSFTIIGRRRTPLSQTLNHIVNVKFTSTFFSHVFLFKLENESTVYCGPFSPLTAVFDVRVDAVCTRRWTTIPVGGCWKCVRVCAKRGAHCHIAVGCARIGINWVGGRTELRRN